MSSASRVLIVSAAFAALAFADAWSATDGSAPKHDSSSASEKVPEVTVTAERAKLERRVQRFVDKITGPLFDGGLTRWGLPVCPMVSGLTPEENEFILGRISDVAHAARVPFAGGNCYRNLYILVTAEPQELLKVMAKPSNLAFTFGFDTTPGMEASSHGPVDEGEALLPPPPILIRKFISKPGAVRVLYRDWPYTPDASGSCGAAGAASHPIVSAAEVGPITMSDDTWYRDSKEATGYCVVWYVFRAFVIVDQARLKGVTLGQFADYVAMVGLAEIKPADSLADAPTILKLFNAAPQACAPGMTDWDRAFLKSLYTVRQSHGQLQGQRRDVAQAMVNEILH